MTQGFVTSQKKVGMMDVIMGHLIKIGELSRQEFRSSYTNVQEVNGIRTEVTITDNRAGYCQAVEFLSDLLFPHYDDETLKVEKEILEAVDEIDSETSSNNDFLNKKLPLMRRLFRQLNVLMKKREYLSAVIVPEENDNEEVVEE